MTNGTFYQEKLIKFGFRWVGWRKLFTTFTTLHPPDEYGPASRITTHGPLYFYYECWKVENETDV